jgi:Ni,Fe-hydrogenase III large subunit/Ni,Fe-hydrogenase III component G
VAVVAEPTAGGSLAGAEPVEWVEAESLGPRVAELVAVGGRFVMLVGLDERSVGGDGLAVEAVVARPDGGPDRLRVRLPLEELAYPSITPLVPAAHWDEREAKDLFGIVPVGHPDPRRLVLHERWPRGYHPLRKDVPSDRRPPEAERHFVPFEVHGEGVYQLPVGPIHAGVIEPGHFRFSAIGERVLHLDARLFFTHRGLEKLVEGRSFDAALPIVERACGVCTVTHALAYAQAVEQLTATEIPPRARWARVVLAELERLYNHVGDLGNICAGIGYQPAVSRIGWLKERLLRVNDSLTGHRYLTGVVAPGGLRMNLDPRGLAVLPGALDAIGSELSEAVRAVVRSEGVMARLHGTGIVTAETALALGAVGVAARASGLGVDLRRDQPYGSYDELDVALVTASAGDVAARFHVRAQEAHESLRLLNEALRQLPKGAVSGPMGRVPVAGDTALGAVEGPRGASWIWLRAGAGGTVDRLRLRSASFANWPVVVAAVPGNLVPDFPLINKSFELCYACTDR